MQLPKHTRTLLALTLLATGAGAAEVTRVQFAKAELDYLGYPTNAARAADLGRSEARRDLSNGVVQLPMYGLPTSWSAEYHHILESRYRIGGFGLAGCMVSAGLLSYADGYSEVSRSYIEQKHGTNIWTLAREEAEKSFKSRPESTAASQPKPLEYQLRAGDTFSRIARERGVRLKQLMEANPGVNPARLKVGQIIRIPARSEAETK